MKNEKMLNPLGVLSFHENSVANLSLSPPVNLLREGTRVIHGFLGRPASGSSVTANEERAFREAVERSREFRERLHRRATAPYIITAISYYRSGPANEIS